VWLAEIFWVSRMAWLACFNGILTNTARSVTWDTFAYGSHGDDGLLFISGSLDIHGVLYCGGSLCSWVVFSRGSLR
jgi:hypothetical protein